jgi:hypothetical protein
MGLFRSACRPVRIVVLLILVLGLGGVSGPARADTYVKLPTVFLEMWDQLGIFHFANLDLVIVTTGPFSVSKELPGKIQRALQSLPYETLSRDDSPETIKSVVMDLIRKEPGGDSAKAVLIATFLFR